jgi:hypothetical protein
LFSLSLVDGPIHFAEEKAAIFRLAALFSFRRANGQYALGFGFSDHLCRACCFHVAIRAALGQANRTLDFGTNFDRLIYLTAITVTALGWVPVGLAEWPFAMM